MSPSPAPRRQRPVASTLIGLPFICCGCLAPSRAPAAPPDRSQERLIRDTLDEQVAAWNRGDIDGFMEGYWKSDALTFSSGGRVTRGWNATRDRYHARYGTREKMGTLSFVDLEISMLEERHALVLGRYRLAFADGRAPAAGGFSLVMARVEDVVGDEKARADGRDGWVVIHDHTSADASSN